MRSIGNREIISCIENVNVAPRPTTKIARGIYNENQATV